MSSGHLPGLFSGEDIKTIIKTIKPVAKAAGIVWNEADRTGATDNILHQFFIERCRANVHVLLVMEQHEQARADTRTLPSSPQMTLGTEISSATSVNALTEPSTYRPPPQPIIIIAGSSHQSDPLP